MHFSYDKITFFITKQTLIALFIVHPNEVVIQVDLRIWILSKVNSFNLWILRAILTKSPEWYHQCKKNYFYGSICQLDKLLCESKLSHLNMYMCHFHSLLYFSSIQTNWISNNRTLLRIDECVKYSFVWISSPFPLGFALNFFVV